MADDYLPHITGKAAEEAVLKHLQQQELKLIETNYSCACGEIDLIMRDKEFYVFVEVRHRKKNSYSDGVTSVTRKKQLKIIRTATLYLQQKKLLNKVHARFDIVGVAPTPKGYEFNWIVNAFC